MSLKPISNDLTPLICSSCQLRASLQARKRVRIESIHTRYQHSSSSTTRFSKSSPDPAYFPPPRELTAPGFTRLSNRSLIRLHGVDVPHFLNGLLPAKLQPHPHTQSTPIFTTFLTAKGRVLYDAFIYVPSQDSESDAWYIDVDSNSAAGLFGHLKKHKLRSKFKLEKVDAADIGVYYVWPHDQDSKVPMPQIGGQDPRPSMGVRFVTSRANPTPTLTSLEEQGESLSLTDYNIHRILSGHAEGLSELISNHALPQESNVDFSHGIDFHKGCYLGQELTIRTHHTGVVRKRILPCQIYSEDQPIPHGQQVPIFDSTVHLPQPASETNISKVRSGAKAGRSTGKWLGGIGNVGLALCRLEMMTDIQLTAEGTNYHPGDTFTASWEDAEPDSDGRSTVRQVKLQPFIPQWLRHSIETSIRARSDRGRRKRPDDEDDEDAV